MRDIRSALVTCRRRLKAARIAAAPLEAELLVGLACRLPRAKLLACADRQLTRVQLKSLRALLRRRLGGTPFAYIAGEKEFRGLSFRVGRGVLIPRPESELLVELALEEATRLVPGWLADVCTGCGAIGVALARELPRRWHVVMSDKSRVAARYASANIRRHLPRGNATLLRGDLYAPLRRHAPRDGYRLVVANPPYVAVGTKRGLQREVLREPAAALFAGANGLEVVGRLAKESRGLLAVDGALILEFSPEQLGGVRRLLGTRFRELSFHRDLARRLRAVVARYPLED